MHSIHLFAHAVAAPIALVAFLFLAIPVTAQQGIKVMTVQEAAATDKAPAESPVEALQLLREGNNRFFSGNATRPELNAFQRRAQILSQSPFAVVLGCSDSRVPIELVFDQGLGDMFVVRVAGNVVVPAAAGSIEYAVKHLNSQLVVIMGHEGCGAVKAALLPMDAQAREPENVRYLLDLITPHVSNIPPLHDSKAFTREAVIRNVRAQVAELRRNPVIAEAEAAGTIAVIGAYYEISSGAVDFVE